MNLSGRIGRARPLRFYKLEPGRPAGRLRRPEPAPGQAPDPRRRVRRRPEGAPRHHRPARHRRLRPAPDRDRRARARSTPPTSSSAGSGAPNGPSIDDALILATQAVAVWVDPGHRRRHEPIQRARRDRTDLSDRDATGPDSTDRPTYSTDDHRRLHRPRGGSHLARQHLRGDVPAGQHQGRRLLGRLGQARPRHPDQAQVRDRRQPPVGRAPARLPGRRAQEGDVPADLLQDRRVERSRRSSPTATSAT